MRVTSGDAFADALRPSPHQVQTLAAIGVSAALITVAWMTPLRKALWPFMVRGFVPAFAISACLRGAFDGAAVCDSPCDTLIMC